MPHPLITLIVAGLLLGLAWLFLRPEVGLVWRWRRASQLTERVRSEDALKHIHEWEIRGLRPSLESVAGAQHLTVEEAATLLGTMENVGLLAAADGSFQLTPQGREAALHIIRAHRLWERYLADQTGFEEADWHDLAERYEHALQPAEVDALSIRLGNPTHDPHGDPIPTAQGEIISHGGRPLPALQVDSVARIVHLEDEPEVIYAQLVAEGLHPGMAVRLIEVSPQRVRFWADGDEHVLAPIIAANISAVPMPQSTWRESSAAVSGLSLASLRPGEEGVVVTVSPRCRGQERRRLMDLGILPGTPIWAEMVSPSGDPTAYRIRDALIALRREQAEMVSIRRASE